MLPNNDEAAPRARTAARSRRTLRTVIAVVIVALALLCAGRMWWMSAMATEGAVPPASAIPLPAGVEIRSESSDCASGGCWATLTLRPPAGQTPEALAEEIGATPQLAIPGNFFDPRTIWVSARPVGSLLLLTADYWSQEWVP
ncbi:hypothetical protein [Microbacterium sp.]|uniref:hypothetical protein n=1 Tax=Microbacterium sp. TaxID=51671 RepID=UPI002810A771|nr:hypothetical protein [Microbacterium sp.]